VLLNRQLDSVECSSAAAQAAESSEKPPRRILLPCLFLLGVASLSYLLGAAVMVFDLPSSSFLYNAFIGVQAWRERHKAPAPADLDPPTRGIVDNPDKTFDGFTLSMHGNDTRAWLLNMRGDVVHEWAVTYSQVFNRPLLGGMQVCFFGSHLYPNGDLLVTFHGYEYGLAKLDKDSRVLWSSRELFHHDMDVGKDGTIYAIKKHKVDKGQAPAGLEHLPTPYYDDCVVLLSPDGKTLKEIKLLEALSASAFAPLLSALDAPRKLAADAPAARAAADARTRDPLHTNCVRVLSKELAPKFPMFKEGQVLVSMRHLDAIAVLDMDAGAVVWATRGPWRAQHDATFLDNGHLLIFDNLGSSRGSRVLEYDPSTQAFPWSYTGNFTCQERGMSQRLPNGNTLVVDSEGFNILEVTSSKELVWSCPCGAFIQSARRYGPHQLHFLEGDQRARP
jgi:hypothetical protein